MAEGAADLVAVELRDDGDQMNIRRVIRHLCSGPWAVRRHFSAADLNEIEATIKSIETAQGGEIRFCVEADLNVAELLSDLSVRARAHQVFSHLRVWDTSQNNGVLLYLLLADRSFEIVADRSISQRVTTEEWQLICDEIGAEFRSGRFLSGVKMGIARIAEHLRAHFPGGQMHHNELSDKPVVL